MEFQIKYCYLFILIFILAISANAQWEKISGSYGGHTECLVEVNNKLFAGTTNGVFVLNESLSQWNSASEGLNGNVTCFVTDSSETDGILLFAGTEEQGIFLTNNEGTSWSPQNSGFTNLSITFLASNKWAVFAATDSGLFRSTDHGNSWSSVTDTLIDRPIECIGVKDSLILTSTNNMVYRSIDNGNTWMEADSGLYLEITPRIKLFKYPRSISFNNNKIYAGSENLIYESSDNGMSWSEVCSISSSWGEGYPENFIFTDSYIFFQNGFNFIRSDYDFSETTILSDNIPKHYINNTIFSLSSINTRFYIGTEVGVLFSDDFGETWNVINNGLDASFFKSIAVDKFNLVCINGGNYIIRSSNDNGNNWVTLNDSIKYRYSGVDVLNDQMAVTAFDPWGSIIEVLVFISFNSGSDWEIFKHTAASSYPFFYNNYIFLGNGYYSEGILRSSIDSLNWIGMSNGLPENPDVTLLYGTEQKIYAGTYDKGIYESSDEAESWQPLNNGWEKEIDVSGITTYDPFIFASSHGKVNFSEYPDVYYDGGGIFRSSDNGDTWIHVNNGLSDTSVASLVSVGKTLIAGTMNGGIFISTDLGNDWTSYNDGLENLQIRSLAINDDYIFVSCLGGIWRRSIFDIPISLPDSPKNTVKSFQLRQNYPNPFNPNTSIEFYLDKKTFASLKVYNILGEEIAELCGKEYLAGNHTVNFNGSKLASGIYFYKIKADNFTKIRKMLLCK